MCGGSGSIVTGQGRVGTTSVYRPPTTLYSGRHNTLPQSTPHYRWTQHHKHTLLTPSRQSERVRERGEERVRGLFDSGVLGSDRWPVTGTGARPERSFASTWDTFELSREEKGASG